VVSLWAGQLAGPPPDRVPDLHALLVFAASTAALGLVVLTVYDTALLYNLGHLGARLPVTAAALAVLTAARVAAPLLPRCPPGPGVESITRSFGTFLPLFFVPALPVRYGLLGWGTTYVAAAATLVLVTAAATRGIAGTLRPQPGEPGALARADGYHRGRGLGGRPGRQHAAVRRLSRVPPAVGRRRVLHLRHHHLRTHRPVHPSSIAARGKRGGTVRGSGSAPRPDAALSAGQPR
jgi:hypothetical protein